MRVEIPLMVPATVLASLWHVHLSLVTISYKSAIVSTSLGALRTTFTTKVTAA